MSSKYFKIDKKQKKVFFDSDKLEVFIPDRFEKFGGLSVEENVEALGVFDMTINDSIETGIFLPAIIYMEPSSVDAYNVGADSLTRLTFHKGDTFMYSEVVKDAELAYQIFHEFIEVGKAPNFIQYLDFAFIMDMLQSVTGLKFKVDHAAFEIIMSYLFRDPDDLSTQYRLTDMKKSPRLIPIRQVAVLAESTTSKLLGSYFDEAVDSALVNKAEESTELEEIMRK